MFKEFSIDNWIIGGTIFILIFTLGCYLWFQNEMTPIQQDVDLNVEIQQVEQSSKTEQIELTGTEQSGAHEENGSDSEDAVNNTPNVSRNVNKTQQKNT